VCGKLLGSLAERINFPSIVGELLAGVILGPMVLGIVHPSGSLDFLANLGVILMMFIMGLSIDIESMMKTGAKGAVSVTLIGAGLVFVLSTIAALLVGLALGQGFGYSFMQACMVGVALTSTSTVIGFKFLTDMGDTFSNVFKTLVSIEVTDGIFSIVLLTVLLPIVLVFKEANDGQALDLGTILPNIGQKTFWILLLILGFMVFVIKFGGAVTDFLLKLSHHSRDDQAIITLALIVLFAVATMSDWLGLTAVIGAFLAGAILAGSQYTQTIIEPKIKALGYGLFIPIFFAYTGVNMDFSKVFTGNALQIGGIGIPLYFILFLVLLVIVMMGKYIGGIVGCALAGGYKDAEAKRIGASIMCAGEDTLVIAQIGSFVYFASGDSMPLITPEIFSVFGLVIIASSVLTPFFIRRTFEEKAYALPTASHQPAHNGKPPSKGKYKSL
jgi:Kef-type K+ transport system membrane component KefB